MPEDQSQQLSRLEYYQWHTLKPNQIYQAYLAHIGKGVVEATVEHHPELGLVGLVNDGTKSLQRVIPEELLVELNRRGEKPPRDVGLVRGILIKTEILQTYAT
ncbi:MAG: hypothetical protein AABX33_01835 [Nanoarchaeota archaeon]